MKHNLILSKIFKILSPDNHLISGIWSRTIRFTRVHVNHCTGIMVNGSLICLVCFGQISAKCLNLKSMQFAKNRRECNLWEMVSEIEAAETKKQEEKNAPVSVATQKQVFNNEGKVRHRQEINRSQLHRYKPTKCKLREGIEMKRGE